MRAAGACSGRAARDVLCRYRVWCNCPDRRDVMSDDMEFVPFDPIRLPELMTWFPDSRSCLIWGGPHFRFPFDTATFRADCLVDSLRTWSLLDGQRRMIAFGQYYAKAERCHLARLAVAPAARGLGLGRRLIEELCRFGSSELGTRYFSLYVMQGNDPARRLYGRLGFVEAVPPDVLPQEPEPILFMVAEGQAASALRKS